VNTLLYDSSFDGFLTSVFTVYNEKLKEVTIQPAHKGQVSLFGESQNIITQPDLAKRVWSRLRKIVGGQEAHRLYMAFLSEQEGMEDILLYYMRFAFAKAESPRGNYADDRILEIAKAAKMVGREKHRMEAFIRFHLTDDDLYFANCEPDFNVLPLIAKHFKSRYADQKWMIFDLKRGFGIYYDLSMVSEVQMDFSDQNLLGEGDTAFAKAEKLRAVTNSSGHDFGEQENAYRDMWNRYFKSTNIKSRKNMALHVRHVPKRYWKYLSEKV